MLVGKDLLSYVTVIAMTKGNGPQPIVVVHDSKNKVKYKFVTYVMTRPACLKTLLFHD